MKTINVDEIIIAENAGTGLELTVLRPGSDRSYERQIKIRFNISDNEVDYLIERISIVAQRRKAQHLDMVRRLDLALKRAVEDFGKPTP